MNEKNTFWEGAGKAGLILGGVSIAYVAVTGLTGLLEDKVGGSFLFSLFGFILWVAKFGGCIYLMRFFMRSYAFNRTDGTGASPFLFGTIVAGILSGSIPSKNPFEQN